MLFYIMHQVGFSIGTHKLLAHRAFKPKTWFLYLSVIVSSICFYGNPLFNVLAHRLHHKYADTDHDPHSPCRGKWHAFMGWIWNYQPPPNSARLIKDLLNDYPWLVTYGKYEWIIPIVVYSLLFYVNYFLFLAVLLGGSLSILNSFIVNAFSHNPSLPGNSKSIDMKFAALWINPIFLHKYHHDVPGLWDYSKHDVEDFSALFIKKWFAKSVR
jgi:fatty-acid desaturase